MKRKLAFFLIIVLLFHGACFAEEAPFYKVVLKSYAYRGNCSEISYLSLPSPIPTPSPTPPPNMVLGDDDYREHMKSSPLQILENTLSKYGMDAGQRQEYLANMHHYSRYNLIGIQRIIGDRHVYTPTYSTLNHKDNIWIEETNNRISTIQDDKEGEGQWGIGFALIIKTEGKTQEEIVEMFNTLQIEISFLAERHMVYEPEFDFEFEDYNEESRTSVIAKINDGGLVRNYDEEERMSRRSDEDSPGWYLVTLPPIDRLPTHAPQN